MKQVLLMTLLAAAACGSGAAQRPSTSVSVARAADVPIPPGSNVDHDDDVRCGIEVPTGSRLSRPVCRSQLQRDTDKQAAEYLLQHPQELR
jgi:hypothetical protein